MSKTFIILLSSIIIILFAGLGVFIYFTNFTPSAQAKRIATDYMSAARANDTQAVAAISTIDKAASTTFFANVSLRDYRPTTSIASDNSYYFLYDFTDNKTPKKARVTVKDNKIIEAKAGDKIGNTPKDDGKEDVAVVLSDDTCLTSSDLAYIDSTDLYARTFRAMTMIFSSSTSLDYAGQANGDQILTRLADFYKISKAKKYTVELRGYATDDPSEYITMTDLAQKRADKMRAELVKQGVESDRIQVKKPTVYPKDADQKDPRRSYIDINITNLCR